MERIDMLYSLILMSVECGILILPVWDEKDWSKHGALQNATTCIGIELEHTIEKGVSPVRQAVIKPIADSQKPKCHSRMVNIVEWLTVSKAK